MGASADGTDTEHRRDLLKSWSADLKEGHASAILGIEPQSYVERKGPIRFGLYDIRAYGTQIKDIWKEIKGRYGDRVRNALEANEWMSRFPKDGKVDPVITVVVSLTGKPWDGPLCLKDMMRGPQFLKDAAFDCGIELIDPYDFGGEVPDGFTTEVGPTLALIGTGNDRDAFWRLMRDPARHLTKDAVRLVGSVVGDALIKRALEDIGKASEGNDDGREMVDMLTIADRWAEDIRNEAEVMSATKHVSGLMGDDRSAETALSLLERMGVSDELTDKVLEQLGLTVSS